MCPDFLSQKETIMDLKKPVNDNVMSYHNRNARECMPVGANRKKPAKAGRWVVKKARNSRPVSFSLVGECKGDLVDVMTLGMKIAREALEQGDERLAERVIKKLKKLPLEREKEQLERQAQRLKEAR